MERKKKRRYNLSGYYPLKEVTMFFSFLVPVPYDVKPKLVFKPNKNSNSTYVHFEYDRVYNSEGKYNYPKRTVIGKLDDNDPSMMFPNENFLKYFPDTELPEKESDSARSSCLKIGSFIVIRKLLEDYDMPSILSNNFNSKETGLLLDMVAYTIIAENNANQYYPDYAYNHPLFTDDMKIYSDSSISRFLSEMEDDQRIGFLNDWNDRKDKTEKIYVSYDSTNKNCQAGEISMVEIGHPKVDVGTGVFNYSIVYDGDNKEPLFYEEYPGSIIDVSQLKYMIDKAYGYGYRNIGFILDRGYFSKENIHYLDNNGYGFIIMCKGMNKLVNQLIRDNKGTFEENRKCFVRDYRCYGKTAGPLEMYEGDKRKRYFHLFYSSSKCAAEREQLENLIEKIHKYVDKNVYKKDIEFAKEMLRYFEPIYHEDGTFMGAMEKEKVIEEELQLCGYYAIITSENMSASQAIRLYKSRDESEKLFRADKSYLGNSSIRVYSDEVASSKIFIEFIALIIRNRMYNCLFDEMAKMDKRPNYMTVPAAIRELEKIEMIKLTDNVYRLDHAITSVQKTILKSFDIDAAQIKKKIVELSKILSSLK